MTVQLNMEKRDGYDYVPLPPFIIVRAPTMLDTGMLIFGVYERRADWGRPMRAVAAKVFFEPEQTLEERKAEVLYAIDLCDLVHRARSDP